MLIPPLAVGFWIIGRLGRETFFSLTALQHGMSTIEAQCVYDCKTLTGSYLSPLDYQSLSKQSAKHLDNSRSGFPFCNPVKCITASILEPQGLRFQFQ